MAHAVGSEIVQFEAALASRRTEPEFPARFATSAWLFPGLGCRFVGMGHDIIGRFPEADGLIAQASAHLGYDVVAVCLEGSGRKHVPTRQESQVIYAIECAYASVLEYSGFTPTAVSGHSLGSLAAGFACGAYDFLTGLDLVTQIEKLQEETVDGRDQAMGVIIGLKESDVEALLATTTGVFLANWNSPGQYVISGEVSGIDGVLSAAHERGAKQSRRLPGQRAMHTPKQREVAARFQEYLESVSFCGLRVPYVSCRDAVVLRTADQLRTFLGEFLADPVRWEATVRVLREGWGEDFVEVGPGNVLSNMLPYIDRTAAIRTASDLLEQK
jgi:[acyl-carrier-protein] S-malonyltransferase